MSKKKILIVENIEDEFIAIKTALENQYGDQVDVRPRNIKNLTQTLEDYNFLIGAFQSDENKFEDIYNFFGPADLYILDVSLLTETDNRGIDFYNHIKEKDLTPSATIFVSQSDRGTLPLPRGKFDFVSKSNYESEYPELIASQAERILNLKPSTGPLIFDVWTRMKLPLIILRTVFRSQEFFRLSIIDPLIRGIFYVLIVTTSIAAILNIGAAILHSLPAVILRSITFIDLQNSKTPATMLPLLTAESIFLNLIPVFIVFGFFTYYETSLREYFVQGNLHRLSDEISTKPMNLSKLLFISSMISYLFVKLIERISDLPPKYSEVPVDLVAYAAVLLLLLGYFVYLNRKHRN